MDLFNIKKLKEQLKEKEKEINRLEVKVYQYEVNERALERMRANDRNIIARLEEKNTRLIDWVRIIIEKVGAYEVKERNTFKIPIYKEIEKKYSEDFSGPFEYLEETIEIPSITLERRVRKWKIC